MQQPVGTEKRSQLRKEINLLGFFSLAFGSIVGVGWITAIGAWLNNAGPVGAMLAFAVGGLVMIFVGLCYAEVTPMLPVAGGEVAYAYKAGGTFKAFVVGWSLAFGYLAVSAFEAISIGKVLGFMFPEINRWPLYTIGSDTVFGTHVLLALIFTGFITWINFIGVGQATKLQSWLTMSFIAMTVLFIIVGLIGGTPANLEPVFAQGSPDHSLAGGLLAVFVTAPFWFVGFDTIPQGAEEAKSSVAPRMLGTLIIVAIVSATLFYVMLILSVGMVQPWQEILHSELPTADAFEAAFQSPVLAKLILTAGLIGLFTSWNGFFLAGSRVLFALGRGKIIHATFGETHERYGTPAYAIWFSGVITFLAALLGRGAMIAFVDVGSLCIVVAFLGVALSTMTLRRTFPHLQRPFRIPGGNAIPRVAVAASLLILIAMLLPGSPAVLVWPLEWLILGSVIVLGWLFWQRAGRSRTAIAESERNYLILEDYD